LFCLFPRPAVWGIMCCWSWLLYNAYGAGLRLVTATYSSFPHPAPLGVYDMPGEGRMLPEAWQLRTSCRRKRGAYSSQRDRKLLGFLVHTVYGTPGEGRRAEARPRETREVPLTRRASLFCLFPRPAGFRGLRYRQLPPPYRLIVPNLLDTMSHNAFSRTPFFSPARPYPSRAELQDVYYWQQLL